MRTNSNWIVPTNATFSCCDEASNVVMNTTCCVTCCDDYGPRARTQVNYVGLTIISLVMTGLCLLGLLNARVRENREVLALQAQAVEHAASQESKKERKRKLKESIINGLIVKEWVLDDVPVVESTEGDQDNPAPLGEAVESRQPLALPVSASSVSCVGSNDCEDQNTPPSCEPVEVPQPPEPPIKSSPASCAMGSEDCDSIVGDEEMEDCAICLSQFKPQQLVCESDNPSCRHIFHKDCMVDWLMKRHDNCPICREVYVLQTTV
jgi:hypothetical protein